MVGLSRKIEAVSIVETISALLLTFIAFGIGMSIYLNVMRTDALVLRSKAATILEQIAFEAENNDRLLDESLERNGFRIEKILKPYKNLGNSDEAVFQVYQLSLKAYDPEDRLIMERESLLYYNRE